MSRVFLNINQTAGPIESSPLVEGDANYERREEKNISLIQRMVLKHQLRKRS